MEAQKMRTPNNNTDFDVNYIVYHVENGFNFLDAGNLEEALKNFQNSQRALLELEKDITKKLLEAKAK